ncbi:hypothetical protein An13g02950 [Aspergillus niger]|uniref:Uncharacterized protein n=2 Tax=Aspergillus niger TaxID=5061 RepID=A2R1Z1_ASPNC|nr:hypothetical protein An13g02950 [Aspergillus niger]CAK41691.1 hypothetical protein An13g02950 [Aspergillus niger]
MSELAAHGATGLGKADKPNAGLPRVPLAPSPTRRDSTIQSDAHVSPANHPAELADYPLSRKSMAQQDQWGVQARQFFPHRDTTSTVSPQGVRMEGHARVLIEARA